MSKYSYLLCSHFGTEEPMGIFTSPIKARKAANDEAIEHAKHGMEWKTDEWYSIQRFETNTQNRRSNISAHWNQEEQYLVWDSQFKGVLG